MAVDGREPGYARGAATVVAGGACLSLAGIVLRNVEAADGWQILFYRAVSFFITLLLVVALRYRRGTLGAFRAIGLRGIAIAVALGLGSVCYVFAILLTTVANAVFIIGASPIFAAAAAWLTLGERVTPAGGVAMLAASVGIGLMFADGLVADRWLGNLLALGVVASFVTMLVLLRHARAVDMLPATCLAGLVTAALAAAMVDGFAVSSRDLGLAVLLGTVQFGGGFVLITVGARRVPAAEVALYSLSEAVLAPLWVWIGVNETPSSLTLAGSAVVLVAVIAYSVAAIRRHRAGRHNAPQ